MKGGKIFSVIFVLIIGILFFLYFFPLNSITFHNPDNNANFSLEGNDSMQFYSNLRYKSNEISYSISNCELQKENEMQSAFEIIENLTILEFNEEIQNPDLLVSCEEKIRYDGDLFIAGEGGPTNITSSGKFNVISRGEILLLRKSSCARPNIAIHELFHALGFKHSSNIENILYNITKCNQIISEDLIEEINRLYSITPAPDLTIKNTSAKLEGRFLDMELVIMNEGLQDSQESQLIISSQGEILKELDIAPLRIGTGRSIILSNLWVSQINLESIDITVEFNSTELNKENNRIKLEIKK